MTTATLIRTESSAVRPTHRPGMTDLMRSEWTKLRTLRSTWWALAAMIVLSVGFTITACAVYTHDFPTLDASTQTEFRQDTIGLILQPGVQFASLAVCRTSVPIDSEIRPIAAMNRPKDRIARIVVGSVMETEACACVIAEPMKKDGIATSSETT